MSAIFNKTFFNLLSEQAKNNLRLRINYDLRNSESDQSQRMLNALCPGTIIPIHRHPDTTETMIVIRGSVCQKYYDDSGNLTHTFILKAGSEHAIINIPAGMWHSLDCIEEGTIIFEAKDGAFQPIKEKDLIK